MEMIETFEAKATVNAMIEALAKSGFTPRWTEDKKAVTLRVKSRSTGKVFFAFSAYLVGKTTWRVVRAVQLFL